ncbi:MAG: hypothetical protein M3Z96_02200 [Pseudomonadota bacterium]|nr:hypothetical protein [Pseudomonadota bacterium]
MSAKRKAGRPKKLLAAIAEPKRPVGRPAVPLLEDRELRIIAFYVAHCKFVKMRTKRGNRILGDNAAATWLAMLRRGDLLKGAAAGDVPGAPEDFVKNCPEGYVPAVPLARGKDWPLHSDDVAGPVKTMKRKAAAIWRTGDAPTLLRFCEIVAIFGLILAGTDRADRGLWTEARAHWTVARGRALSLGEPHIASMIDLAEIAPLLPVEDFDPLSAIGVPEK